jgi:virulence factor Mce-like protein
VLALSAAMALMIVAGVAFIVRSGPSHSLTITAHFSQAPGLYGNNAVAVLGVPVGRVTRIKAGPNDVAVRMNIRHGVHLPPDVFAVLMSPNVVSDRFIQLTPAYTGGPMIPNGYNIPLSNTRLPVSVDEITSTLDQLAKAFGPNGADQNGTLQTLLHNLALNLQGNGQNAHDTITALSGALGALSHDGPAIGSTVTNLDQLTQTLASNNGVVSSLYGNLAAVSDSLSGDSHEIGTALSTLQSTLGQVAQFIQQNQGSLTQTVANLNTALGAVAKHQRDLTEAFDVGPLGLQNFGGVANPSYNSPNGKHPAARALLDLIPGTADLVSKTCGPVSQHVVNILGSALPGLNLLPQKATSWDTLCVAANGVDVLPTVPNAPVVPNLNLAALIGASR